ncbi:RagB/SusD family nutrient uptake outer membrane protein [Flavobacterium sp. CS20]|uniref:RagB/SusD family nutrient uptake outer membrane protein n=1 Tax=Flavobacterium sp. CS20 TaxID=2775246 RepID=UPI001B39F712|nr:RagB/SusD family nutrient uptake outer membrane protein [Flavobacterium sp. CS20]QTY26904.1 RagB/SusD family nutrient uptake outer membrane protein [Flavobacterium sp. CS20]
MANQAQYQAMFNGDTDQTEVIYSYDNVAGANLENMAGQFIFTGTGGNFIDMSFELFNLLEQESLNNNDVRFDVNVNLNGNIAGGELGINKYPPGSGLYVNDYKVARISEVYLMRAEAFARQSQFQEVADAVQAVRNVRRDTSDGANAYTSLQEAIADIKFERRLELCFEGHRYIDIKRYRNILNEGLERNPEDCEGSIPCNINVSDQRWVFPIPLEELNGNTNMVQNAQWQ